MNAKIPDMCFTCDTPLHQTRLDGRESRSFPTCFSGKRICEDCESEFERRELPARAIGTLEKRFAGVYSEKELKRLDQYCIRKGIIKIG